MSTFKQLQKPTRIVDRKYREWVKIHPCVFKDPLMCDGPIDPAHISPRDGTKGTASKVSDYRCLPMCRFHHEMHGSGSSATLPYLDSVIETYNSEYRALFPAKEKRERQSSARVGLGIKNC